MPEDEPGFFPHSYFHVGLVVPDLDVAIPELELALGLDFNPPHTSTYGPTTIRVAYAVPGPPFIEVVQGVSGSLWDTDGGPRMDHVGYFTRDLDADVDRLVARGLPVDIDGREHGATFTYHRSASTGMRVELIDVARRESLMRTIFGET